MSFNSKNQKYSDIICWTKSGEGFVVKKVKEFAENILPTHFRHSNYTSFVRQVILVLFSWTCMIFIKLAKRTNKTHSKTPCSREDKSTCSNKLKERTTRKRKKSQKGARSQGGWLTKIKPKMVKKFNIKNNFTLKACRFWKKLTRIWTWSKINSLKFKTWIFIAQMSQ